jgi:hypothetical protein
MGQLCDVHSLFSYVMGTAMWWVQCCFSYVMGQLCDGYSLFSYVMGTAMWWDSYVMGTAFSAMWWDSYVMGTAFSAMWWDSYVMGTAFSAMWWVQWEVEALVCTESSLSCLICGPMFEGCVMQRIYINLCFTVLAVPKISMTHPWTLFWLGAYFCWQSSVW